nr:hypothetical protein [Fusobacterium gastrosuis]
MKDVLNSKIATTKKSVGICTDCWFSHKELKEISSSFTKIGKVEFEEKCMLWVSSPATNLQSIYEEITNDKKGGAKYFSDVSKIVKNVL